MKKILILISIILVSFSSQSQIRKSQLKHTYYFGKVNTIKLYDNHKYIWSVSYGDFKGTWRKIKDTLILNSKYSPDSMNIKKIDYSNSDSTKCTIVSLEGPAHRWSELYLFGHGGDTTLTFMFEEDHRLCKNYDRGLVKLVKRNGPTAYTSLFNFNNGDSVSIYLDYTYAWYNYRFFRNKKFLIKQNQLLEIKKD